MKWTNGAGKRYLLGTLCMGLLCWINAQVVAAQVDTTPWTIEPVWTIGGDDGDVFFSWIDGAAIGFNDRVYVHENRIPFLRVFDTSGNEISQLGTEGEGPGEFDEVTSILPVEDGNVFVQDRRNGRISEFGPSGKLLRTIVIPEVTTRTMQLLAYDKSSDRISFLAQSGRSPDDLHPLLYVGNLQAETSNTGVFMPEELLDLDDEVFGFFAYSPMTYKSDYFKLANGNVKIGITPRNYDGSIALTAFSGGAYSEVRTFKTAGDFKTRHATVLDITQEEARKPETRIKYRIMGGTYTQHGIQQIDIHNTATFMVWLDDNTVALLVWSDEDDYQGMYLDIFNWDKGHIGRHRLNIPSSLTDRKYINLQDSRGPNELYISYMSKDEVPMFARVKLVMK